MPRLLALAALAALALALAAPAPAQAGCGEVSNCRLITSGEDAALRQALTALERALPVPDGGWERAASSDGMAEREARLRSPIIPGAPAAKQYFHECEPTWRGCWPRETELTIGYQRKGNGAKTQAKAGKADAGSMGGLLELAQAVTDSMQYGVTVSVRLAPHPVDNGCEQSEGYPRPVEKSKDFLLETYASDGQATTSLVFGERACQEPDDLQQVTSATPMAPVRAVVVKLEGPEAVVKQLAAKIDRKVFSGRLGPVR
ncbi:MAG: hypothetical protein QM767_20675 [Anaeromyxobacter sp.]